MYKSLWFAQCPWLTPKFTQADQDWIAGLLPVQSVVPPLANYMPKKSALNSSEFEVFTHHTSGASGDATSFWNGPQIPNSRLHGSDIPR
jgi:hypothetical protein